MSPTTSGCTPISVPTSLPSKHADSYSSMTRPIKVFGIGLHRTGTTSLAAALDRLGFRCRHHPYALFEDLGSPLLAEYEAFCDLPVPLLYPDLDAAFPGSKFVCTTRDLDSWLKSTEWLFTVGRRRFRWDREPIIDQIHRRLYGIDHFDAEVFERVWHQHHEAVETYFADRPGDLLWFDFSKGAGWEPLCSFLEVPVPDEPFPHTNTGTSPSPKPPQEERGWWHTWRRGWRKR